MLIMDPQVALVSLLDGERLSLDAVPATTGMYGLRDHFGVVRYIGITDKGFADRLRRHVGGDGNSHKFSSAYNAGRMYHTRHDALSCKIGGKLAKELRRAFARRFCSASVLPIPGASKTVLETLELAVIAIAPPENVAWNNARALKATEPAAQVDELLASLAWGQERREAIGRQAARWSTITG